MKRFLLIVATVLGVLAVTVVVVMGIWGDDIIAKLEEKQAQSQANVERVNQQIQLTSQYVDCIEKAASPEDDKACNEIKIQIDALKK